MALDPLTAATTFATLVSLIFDFRSQHKELSENDYKKFLEWLSESRHDEIKSIVEQNQETVISLKAILNQDYTVISEKLNKIDSKLASLLSEDGLFSSLVKAIKPEYLLSEQAASILVQFESSQASEMLEVAMYAEGTLYTFMDGLQGMLDCKEPRFIKDDLKQLVELGLLTLSANSSGKNIFQYTRRAAEFVNAMSG